jgi:hypothetical protein
MYALPLEPGSLQCPLLSDVVHLSTCLQPVHRRRGEEIGDELPLGLCSYPMSPMLGKQRDPDFNLGWAADPTPGHPTCASAIVKRNREIRGLLAHEAVLVPPPLQLVRKTDPEPEPLKLTRHVGIGQQSHKLGEVVLDDWPQQDNRTHGTSLAHGD